MIRTEVVRENVPDALVRPCPPRWRKAGGPVATGDFVERGDHNEAALAACAAQVDSIRKWNDGIPRGSNG